MKASFFKRLSALLLAVLMMLSLLTFAFAEGEGEDGELPPTEEQEIAPLNEGEGNECTHVAGDAVVVNATCTTDGSSTVSCAVCGVALSAETFPAGHSYGEAVVVNATCTEAGSSTATCAACGEVLTVEIPATGHSYTENVTKAANCTEAGQKTLSCACGDVQTVEIPAAHTPGEAVVVDATCTTDGSITVSCTVEGCDYSQTETIPAGHKYENGVCSVCGEAEPVPCSYRPDCAADEHAVECIKGNVDKVAALFAQLPLADDVTVENFDAVKAQMDAIKAIDDAHRLAWAWAGKELEMFLWNNVLQADANYVEIYDIIANGVMMMDASDGVARIGNTVYPTLNEAITAANSMTGDVTITILGKAEYNDASPDLSGAYDSINFVGVGESAEIWINRNGSNGYISGGLSGNDCAVTFSNLKLSKSAGGFADDAGFMNVAFSVYRVGSVSYTDCTFLNGACAAGCPTTYTRCTFLKSHEKYSFWAYGADVTVDNCIFDDDRGIKMFAEGAAKTTALTVTGSDFSKLAGKPAIVLTYGESVTLSGNKYSDTGVFELDLDGAPNGTPVTSDVLVTCKNDNGACGVMVGGKIYTTVAQAAAAATSGDTVTLLHNSTETVELPAGVFLDKNGFTADNVSAVSPVAEVNGTPYTSLQEAINNANGKTVTLLDDIELADGIIIPEGSSVTLDLAGKTISRNTNAAASSAAITNNGTLTIQDSGVRGKITAFAANPDTAEIPYYANNTITNCGIFTLISGTIENSTGDEARAAYPIDNNSTVRDAIVYIQGGTVTGRGAIRQYANSTTNKNEVYITGGTVEGTSYGIWTQNPGSGDPEAKLSISENADVAKVLLSPSANFDISITGGTVSDVAAWGADTTNTERNPSGFITGGTFTNGSIDQSLLAKGYTLVENSTGGYSPQLTDPEAKIGDTPYATLSEAVDAANNAGGAVTITVQKDVELTEGLTVTGTVTLDLNGKTITGTPTEAAAYAVITNKGSLTINATNGGAIICNHTLTGSTAYAVNTINNGGNLTINGGTIENKSAAGNQIGYAIDNNSTSGNAVVSINGGSVTVSGSSYYDGIRLFCNHENADNSVTVNGGSVSSIWLQNPSDGDAVKNAKDVKGSVTIANGTVNALYLEPSSNFAASIIGGNIGSVSYYEQAEGRNLSGIITGGIFNTDTIDPSLLAEGYTLEPNGNNTYSPVPSNDASINGKLYKNLANAFQDATDGDTIKLLRNVELSGELAINKTLTIDPNGFTLDVSSVTKITVADGKVLTINLDFNTYGAVYKDLAPELCVTKGSIKIQNHVYVYSGSDDTITETCTNGCTHSATAKLERNPAVSTVYTGKEIEALKVTYSDNWKAAKDLTITYSDNVNIGKNATGTITKTFDTDKTATATATFEITRAAYTMTPNNLRYVRGSGYSLSFTTNIPYDAANTLNALTIYRANGTLVMNVPIHPSYVVLSANSNRMTVITLSAAVMNSLEALNYELVAEFAYGTASTPFRVLLPFIFPMTGDEANTIMLLTISLVALGGAAAIVITMRKKQRRDRHGR